jgi:cytoskeleton protein RodZ
MSEVSGQPPNAAQPADAAASDSALTAGALLRRAREASGMHVAALAVSLKVPVRKLEALEDDMLPDAVFARGLARSVCRTLKIDPQPVLDRLPRSAPPRLAKVDEGINTPFRAPGDDVPLGWRNLVKRPVFLAVAALLAGAAVLIFLPSLSEQDLVVSAASTPAPAGAVETGAVETVRVESVTPRPIASTRSMVEPDRHPQPSPAGLGAPLAGGAVASDTPAVAGRAPGAAAVTALIVFRASTPSWVEVVDAKGLVAVRRVLAAGESTGASGTPPMQVIVGRADATEVQVRGKPFDLRPVSRDNVARFEVK